MKGIVFTEFLEMVETRFGADMADRVIDASQLANGGAYTSVGTYDHAELLRMVGCLSRETGTGGGDLVKAFGEYLIERFGKIYPQFFAGVSSTFEFLPMVESHIHVEVKKLYPEADLPRLDCRREGEDVLVVEYSSQKPFADLAEGMIAGSGRHFGERLQIEREDMQSEAGHASRFVVRRL
jgi:hypothetical protein